MDIYAKIGYFVVDLVLPLLVGYLCRRQTRAGEAVFQRMMTASIQVVYPVLALLGFWATRLSAELMLLPVIGIIMMVIPGVIGYFRAKAKYADGGDQGSYVMAAALSNTLTLGGISAFIIYGEVGFAYVQLITLLGSAFLFLVAFPVAQYYSRSGEVQSRRLSAAAVIFSRNQLPVLGLMAGAALYYGGVTRPEWAGALFDPLVHIGAWLTLIPVGYSADFGEMRHYWLDAVDLAVIKFIVTPVLIYVLASPLIDDPVVLNTILLTASTPTAIFAVVAVKVHRLNIHITMASFVLTTAVYMLLVYPLQFLWLAGRL